LEKIAVGILFFAGLIVVAPLIGVLGGAFSGWIVGFFWTDPILDFMRRIGVETEGLTVWQIGAAMGFLGGFLKTSTTTRESK
jgi:hypothetical protein